MSGFILPRQWRSRGTKTGWLPTFFKISVCFAEESNSGFEQREGE